MGISNLTEGHRNQIKEMRSSGKSNKEIAAYFSATYNIALTPNDVWYVCKDSNKTPGSGSVAKRKYTKRLQSKPIAPEEISADKLIKDIFDKIEELKSLYHKQLLKIRLALIEACDKAREKEAEE